MSIGSRRRLPGDVVALIVLCAVPVLSQTVTLQPAADTTLFEVAPDNNLGGAGFFNAGTAGNGLRNRGLILFDLSSIPQGSIVTEASLSLEVVRQPITGLEHSLYSLRRVLQSWNEGTQVPESENSPGLGAPANAGEATWNHRSAGALLWSAPGGQAGVDYVDTTSALAPSAGTGDFVFFESTPEMINDLNAWLAQPENNFGWMLMTESEELLKTARSFASLESGFGPTLTIQYQPVPEPGAVVLATIAAGMLIGWRWPRCRSRRCDSRRHGA